RSTPTERLHQRPNGTWSILQNAGHLADVEELWAQRLEDLRAARQTMTPANPDHFRALAERHTTRSVDQVVEELRERRARFVHALVGADADLQQRSAFHERLACAMRLVDCAQFAAEHDDHHLLRMRALRGEVGPARARGTFEVKLSPLASNDPTQGAP